MCDYAKSTSDADSKRVRILRSHSEGPPTSGELGRYFAQVDVSDLKLSTSIQADAGSASV